MILKASHGGRERAGATRRESEELCGRLDGGWAWHTKNVAILGASYGGARAACLLAQTLPDGWRVVLVDRNSHMNHLYVLPRYAVLPGHEHKAFIPYHNVFNPPPAFDAPPPAKTSLAPAPLANDARRVFLHASVTSLAPHSLTLDRAFPEFGVAESDRTLRFDYLIYALGSHLPAPIDLWGPVADEEVDTADVLDVARGTKHGGVAWLKRFQQRVARASSVLVVGGGALGIRECLPIRRGFLHIASVSEPCARETGSPERLSPHLHFLPIVLFCCRSVYIPPLRKFAGFAAASGRVGRAESPATGERRRGVTGSPGARGQRSSPICICTVGRSWGILPPFFPSLSFVDVKYACLPLRMFLLGMLSASGRVGGCAVQPLSRERPVCLSPYERQPTQSADPGGMQCCPP